jgi:hypothetical protein
VRNFVIVLLTLTVGGFIGHELWRFKGEGQDPVQVVLTQLKTHAVIEQERQLAVWYRVCPSVIGVTPQIFMAWPVRLTYQIELGDVQVSRDGNIIHVKTSAIHSVDPAIPTDFMDHLTATSIFTFANEHELLNNEIAKATPVARYLTTYFLAHDPSLPDGFREEMQSLVEHFTSSLGIPITQVVVDIPPVQVGTWPRLPKIELCPGTQASVNGLPFAKFDLGSTIPIGFRIPPKHLSWRTEGQQSTGTSANSTSAAAASAPAVEAPTP